MGRREDAGEGGFVPTRDAQTARKEVHELLGCPGLPAEHRPSSAAGALTQSAGVFEISIIYVFMLWVNAD